MTPQFGIYHGPRFFAARKKGLAIATGSYICGVIYVDRQTFMPGVIIPFDGMYPLISSPYAYNRNIYCTPPSPRSNERTKILAKKDL